MGDKFVDCKESLGQNEIIFVDDKLSKLLLMSRRTHQIANEKT